MSENRTLLHLIVTKTLVVLAVAAATAVLNGLLTAPGAASILIYTTDP